MKGTIKGATNGTTKDMVRIKITTKCMTKVPKKLRLTVQQNVIKCKKVLKSVRLYTQKLQQKSVATCSITTCKVHNLKLDEDFSVKRTPNIATGVVKLKNVFK
jgi:hypothetical protein